MSIIDLDERAAQPMRWGEGAAHRGPDGQGIVGLKAHGGRWAAVDGDGFTLGLGHRRFRT